MNKFLANINIFKKLNTKTKYIIYSLIIILAIVLLYYVAEDNKKKQEQIKTKYENQIKTKEEENQAIEDENNKIAEEAKEKKDKIDDLYAYGLNQYENENFYGAIEKADEILVLDDMNYEAYSLKGIAQCFTQKYNEGMVNLDKALEIKEDYGFGLFNKGLAYDLVGKYEDALVYFNKSAEQEDYGYCYYKIAEILKRQGKDEEALENLKKAIDIDPSLEDKAKNNIILKDMKNT